MCNAKLFHIKRCTNTKNMYYNMHICSNSIFQFTNNIFLETPQAFIFLLSPIVSSHYRFRIFLLKTWIHYNVERSKVELLIKDIQWKPAPEALTHWDVVGLFFFSTLIPALRPSQTNSRGLWKHFFWKATFYYISRG